MRCKCTVGNWTLYSGAYHMADFWEDSMKCPNSVKTCCLIPVFKDIFKLPLSLVESYFGVSMAVFLCWCVWGCVRYTWWTLLVAMVIFLWQFCMCLFCFVGLVFVINSVTGEPFAAKASCDSYLVSTGADILLLPSHIQCFNFVAPFRTVGWVFRVNNFMAWTPNVSGTG